MQRNGPGVRKSEKYLTLPEIELAGSSIETNIMHTHITHWHMDKLVHVWCLMYVSCDAIIYYRKIRIGLIIYYLLIVSRTIISLYCT